MRLVRRAQPFDHPEWIFELKYDGFRALAHVRHGGNRLISRSGKPFAAFAPLSEQIADDVQADAVLDGEIVCLDGTGSPRFEDLLFHRAAPVFAAFDVLWCDGEDTRFLPVTDRKLRLRQILRKNHEHVLYVDHLERYGTRLFQQVCRHDLEGIVAKWRFGAYDASTSDTSWLKIKNRAYTQAVGREQLFGEEPVPLAPWAGCAIALARYSEAKGVDNDF